MVGIELDLRRLKLMPPKLETLVTEGEAMHSVILREHPIRASAASKMFRAQFSYKVEG
jgi:hypothetical protein